VEQGLFNKDGKSLSIRYNETKVLHETYRYSDTTIISTKNRAGDKRPQIYARTSFPGE
jgi:hypothetical protein